MKSNISLPQSRFDYVVPIGTWYDMSFSPYHKTPLVIVLQGYIFKKRKEKNLNLTFLFYRWGNWGSERLAVNSPLKHWPWVSSFPSLEFDCEEENIQQTNETFGMMKGVWWAGLYKQEAENTDSAWKHPSTLDPGRSPKTGPGCLRNRI